MGEAQISDTLRRLVDRLEKAPGGDKHLDHALHEIFASSLQNTSYCSNSDNVSKELPVKDSAPPFSSSAKASITLVETLLPNWKWHVGYGVMGIFPYASVTSPEGIRLEGKAPTVPLALLLATVRALSRQKANGTTSLGTKDKKTAGRLKKNESRN